MIKFSDFINKVYLVELAQNQGTVNHFTYYTFDSEHISHYPHAHLCVKSDDKTFKKGKILKTSKKLKTLGSVRLRYDEEKYTKSNIEFETMFDERIQYYRDEIAEFLNDQPIKRLKDYTNSDKCLIDYDLSNKKYLDYDNYQNRIKLVKGED